MGLVVIYDSYNKGKLLTNTQNFMTDLETVKNKKCIFRDLPSRQSLEEHKWWMMNCFDGYNVKFRLSPTVSKWSITPKDDDQDHL